MKHFKPIRMLIAALLALTLLLAAVPAYAVFIYEEDEGADDDISVARECMINNTVAAVFEGVEDDWYYIEIPYDGVGHFIISHDYKDDSGNYCFCRLMTYDGASTTLYQEFYAKCAAEKTEGAPIGLREGKYYIQLHGFRREDYQFLFEFEKDDHWELEKNNHVKTATPLEIGDVCKGHSAETSDDDYFVFKLPAAQAVQITVKKPYLDDAGNFCQISVRDYDGSKETEVKSFYVAAKSDFIKSDPITLPAGEHYICLHSYYPSTYEVVIEKAAETPSQSPAAPKADVKPDVTTTTAAAAKAEPKKDAVTAAAQAPAAAAKAPTTQPRPQEMLPAVVTAAAQAENAVPEVMLDGTRYAVQQAGDFTYFLQGEEAVLVRYTGAETGTVTLPDTLDGHPVAGIADHAFADSDATVADVPAGIYRFGAQAFESRQGKMKIFCDENAPVVEYAQTNGLETELRQPAAAPTAETAAQTPAKSKTALIVICVAVLVLAAAGILGYFLYQRRKYPKP